MEKSTDLYFFKCAMEVARKALPIDEVPVGCVVVRNSRIIASSHNMTNQLKDPLAHAEFLCTQLLIDRKEDLSDLTFYITLEPCAMCAGILERVGARVVFGYHNDIFGSRKILNKNIGECLVIEEAIDLLKEFYKTPNTRTSG